MRNAAIYLVVFTLTALAAQSSPAQIAWEGKLRDAHTKAKQQGKLMLLHFYTDNCIYCDRLEAGAFRSASVSQSINQNFVAVKVHGTKNPKLAEMFKVTKYPTDVIVTTDGKALSHSVSPQQPDRYIAMLTDAQVSYAKTRTLASTQQTAPTAASPAATAAPATTPAAGVAVNHSLANHTLPKPTSNRPKADMAPGELPVQIPAPGVTMESATPATVTDNSRKNQFMLPGGTKGNVRSASVATSGSVQASLASARTGGLTLPTDTAADMTPADATSARAATTAETTSPESKPDLAIQGYCAVSVVNRGQWVEGKPELGVIHLGKLYLFADKEAMELFLSDPIPFTPMLNEIDVVRFFEEKKIVPGKREWGVIDPIHNRMFFFADEAAMLHFEKTFDRYLDAAIEVMDQAIEESNPGV
ncbi:thiol:disulfide interchange protein precursor [Stieleria maiorica]|uniref:Thiol:disulfide interchange protein n=1 Tax=Stieleria maiorica TaxID=2795974 RepID=A0A5B9MMC6_9BACT|nr:thioredoxin family protein [Stieleria maiorica]QEG02164.1 thiol:disulfide interchange protein precursor [Stieleria maiorica]